MSEVEVKASSLMGGGEEALEKGWCNEARLAYAAAGAEMPKDRLIACGAKALEMGWFREARESFEAAAAIGWFL